MLQQCVCRDIEHLGSLGNTQEATPLSCSPNFPRAQYLDIRTLPHELIVNLTMLVITGDARLREWSQISYIL